MIPASGFYEWTAEPRQRTKTPYYIRLKSQEPMTFAGLWDVWEHEDDAIQSAVEATDAFAAWLESEAPSKTGPSGVGADNYTWYMHNVHLVPYGWEEQVTMMRLDLLFGKLQRLFSVDFTVQNLGETLNFSKIVRNLAI